MGHLLLFCFLNHKPNEFYYVKIICLMTSSHQEQIFCKV